MDIQHKVVTYSVGVLETWAGRSFWRPIHRNIHEYEVAMKKANESSPKLRIMRHTEELIEA